MFSYQVAKKEGTLYVKLMGDLDHHGTVKLRNELDQLILREERGEVVLDLGGISFMDSSGIGFLLGRYKLVKQQGGNLSAVQVKKPLMRIFKMSGITKIIQVEEVS